MSLIIRLQGLPAVANSFDIREFFSGLSIPRGGVYITGGKFGEAFIVFATYDDARYALSLSGRMLKDSYIRLVYSNEEEMRHALEIFQIGLQPKVGSSYDSQMYPGANKPSFSYLYVHGMPIKATKVEIREFFRGLLVEDVLFLKLINGVRNGNAIVKFGRSTDATEGLKLHSLPICGSPVTLKLSNEVEWVKNGGEVDNTKQPVPDPPSLERRRSRSRSRSPRYRYRSRSPRYRYRSRSPRYRSRSRSPRYRSRSRSPRYRSRSRSRSRSPRYRRRGSPYVRRYFVHIINVSYRADKKDIKKFFFDLEMKDSQITFLVDKEGRRTREAFAMFTTEKDYKRALGLDKALFKGHTVTILPISGRDMLQLIDRMKVRLCRDHRDRKRSPSRSSKERRYLYLRNFAFDVTKADVQKFFTGQTVKEDDIILLRDNKGVGIGEALVKFADEKEASKAEKENNQTYLGIKILLTCITEEQKKAVQEANQGDESVVTEADDVPDFTSDPLPPEVPGEKAPTEPVNGESTAPESSEVGVQSNSENVPPSNKESEVTADSDIVQKTPLVESDPIEEGPEDANDGDEEPTYETKKSEVTLLFIRNLPASVTANEILDFFHDYKVSSVNLKNIERGIATVRLPSYAEAVSAIEKLNKKEVGLKQVYLSLI